MKEKFRKFVNKLLPCSWQLIMWYSISECKPKENTMVFCKGGIGLSHHYAAIYRNGEFTDMYMGKQINTLLVEKHLALS